MLARPIFAWQQRPAASSNRGPLWGENRGKPAKPEGENLRRTSRCDRHLGKANLRGEIPPGIFRSMCLTVRFPASKGRFGCHWTTPFGKFPKNLTVITPHYCSVFIRRIVLKAIIATQWFVCSFQIFFRRVSYEA